MQPASRFFTLLPRAECAAPQSQSVLASYAPAFEVDKVERETELLSTRLGCISRGICEELMPGKVFAKRAVNLKPTNEVGTSQQAS